MSSKVVRTTQHQDGNAVAHPDHYNAHPSGVECIDVVEHMGFNLGNAMKYIWRADLKLDAIEDLKKARWYVDRELRRRDAGGDGLALDRVRELARKWADYSADLGEGGPMMLWSAAAEALLDALSGDHS